MRCFRSTHAWRYALVIAVLALELAATACSGGSSKPIAASPPATPAAPGVSTIAPRSSAGCSAQAPPAGAETETIEVGGVSRTYRRFVPSAQNGPVPVVVDLHGLLETIDIERAVTQFEALAQSEGFVVLTPQGLGTPPGWDQTQSRANKDIPFINAMLDQVESSVCVDTARVYAAGISNGGMMSALLACYEPQQFAAIGLVSGILHPKDCDASRPVPMVIFWGKDDPTLPYCGGVGPGILALLRGTPVASAPPPKCPPDNDLGFPPVEDVVASWAKSDGCGTDPAHASVAQHVDRRTYPGCSNGASVQFYVIVDGGHAWPGSKVMEAINGTAAAALVGHTTDEIDATKLIWQFFQRYAIAP